MNDRQEALNSFVEAQKEIHEEWGAALRILEHVEEKFAKQYVGKFDSEGAFWREHFLSLPLEQQIKELGKFLDLYSLVKEIEVEGSADWLEYIDWEAVAEEREEYWFIETITDKCFVFREE